VCNYLIVAPPRYFSFFTSFKWNFNYIYIFKWSYCENNILPVFLWQLIFNWYFIECHYSIKFGIISLNPSGISDFRLTTPILSLLQTPTNLLPPLKSPPPLPLPSQVNNGKGCIFAPSQPLISLTLDLSTNSFLS